MSIYQLRGATVTGLAALPAATDDAIVFTSADQLADANMPMADLVAIWNGLPGVAPLTKFKDRKIAVRRLWAEFAKLPVTEPAPAAKPKREKSAPAPRAESKQALVIAMLRHPGGATLDEIVDATGWQKHTVRGAISGALKKKLGLAVQSDRRDDGRRAYSIA
jgi:hypothetical protein